MGMIPYLSQLVGILAHKWYVLRAGLAIGGIPLWRLLVHDLSKFHPIEFFGYAQCLHGTGRHSSDEAWLKMWARSWHHHMHSNPHHPEYWLLSWRGDPNYYHELGEDVAPYVVALPMPGTYVREWVADMMAASMEHTGSYDISAWLNLEGPKWYLHSITRNNLMVVMKHPGYSLMEENDPWTYKKTW